MKSHTIKGGGGVALHVVETGNATGARFCSSTAFRSVGSRGVGN